MLVPAILYKDEILKELQKYFYTTEMFYGSGCMSNWNPEISEFPNAYTFQYAIVDKDKNLIGYFGYLVDWYSSKAYNFGLFSFDKGNVIISTNVYNKLEELISRFHKVEWRMIEGNPAERNYDFFCEKHNGIKHILKDSIKDAEGNYRDEIIYEIINEKK